MKLLLRLIAVTLALGGFVHASFAQEKQATFTLFKGDRVAWIGSSSTNIGVWPKTMEFLLRTRHPELKLQFKKFSTGGGTFATGVQNLDKWLDDFRPTVVLFNYGGNDANAGEKGLAKFKENIAVCVGKVEAKKARVVFTTCQGTDVRKSGEAAAIRRQLYADAELALCKEKGWPIVDVLRPLDALQLKAQMTDAKFTILRDSIHLTDPAYIAWGFFLYDGLRMRGISEVTIDVNGKGAASVAGCDIAKLDIANDRRSVKFIRADHILPILPPGALPPRALVPLEFHSAYLLRVAGLPKGKYDVSCEGTRLGAASDAELAKGINLNTLVLDSGITPPWANLAKQLWAGKDLEQIGKTHWTFRIEAK